MGLSSELSGKVESVGRIFRSHCAVESQLFELVWHDFAPDATDRLSQSVYDGGGVLEPSRAAEFGAVTPPNPRVSSELDEVVGRLTDSRDHQRIAILSIARQKKTTTNHRSSSIVERYGLGPNCQTKPKWRRSFVTPGTLVKPWP